MTGFHQRQQHAVEAPGAARRPRTAPRRAFFFLLPNLADDSDLDVYAFRLLAHYQRSAGDNGTCVEPTATTAARCRMSPRRVIQARTELRDAGWITVAYAGPFGQQVPVVSMVDRMADNLARYDRPGSYATAQTAVSETAAAGAGPACTMDRPRLQQVQAGPAPAGRRPDKTPEDTGTPPLTPQTSQQRRQGEGVGTTATGYPSPPRPGVADEPERALIAAFYRGLASTPSAATSTMQRRDLAIARELVAVGATPAEVEAYTVETSGLEGRLAPVDLRSFERERAGWLVRHRRHERRHSDRTGQPPTWLEGATVPAPMPSVPRQEEPVSNPPGPAACLRVTGGSELAGSGLGRALRDMLRAGVA